MPNYVKQVQLFGKGFSPTGNKPRESGVDLA